MNEDDEAHDNLISEYFWWAPFLTVLAIILGCAVLLCGPSMCSD